MALNCIPSLMVFSLVLPHVMASAQTAVSAKTSSVIDLTSYVQSVAQPNQALIKLASANQTTPILVSSDNSYAWQFFTHNKTRPDQRLLVVLSTLYNTTVVWIANRDHPVFHNATLYYDTLSGSLLLQNPNTTAADSPAWKCAADAGGGPIRSILMNTTGNLLMLSTGGNNITAPSSIYNSSILWQSFDYPADVLVTGQKIRTNRYSTSSVSTEDWSSGRYTLVEEPGGAVLYATFDAQQTMVPYLLFNYVDANVPYLFSNYTPDTFYNTSLHSACNRTEILYKDDGSGVTLEQQGGLLTPQCDSENSGNGLHNVIFATPIGGIGFRFLRIMPNGDMNSFFRVDNLSGLILENSFSRSLLYTYCKLPSYCGVNGLCSGVNTCTCPQLFDAIDTADATKGCRLQTPLNCSVSHQHQFLEVAGMDYYANTYMTPYATVGSADECADLCRPNCSCTAAFFNNQTQACHLYDQVQSMYYNGSNPSITALLRVAHLPSSASSGSGPLLSTKVIVGVAVGLAGTIVLLGLIIGWIVNSRLAKRSREDMDYDTKEEAFLDSLPCRPLRFAYKDLRNATNGFSSRLGSGGSGTVYEGNLAFKDGLQGGMLERVAIKELNTSNTSTIAASSKRQFRAEVATLGCLNHVNLVQLRGFCAEGVHRLLIYEYMESGSLDRWIFPTTDRDFVLPWDVRYRIAVDTARGLSFLHEESREKVVHLDIKPQNILLDGALRAKLADFGLSKLMERGQSQTVTAMRGTPGYMAPEWLMDMHIITPKSDVFSYGMVLLELVAGRKNLNLAVGSEEWYLAKWAVKQAERGNLGVVVDKRLGRNVAEAVASAAQNETEPAGMLHMKRLLNIAFWCIQEDANARPSMTTVLLMLEEHLQVPEPPLHKAYILRTQSRPNLAVSGENSSTCFSSASGGGSLQPR